MDACEIIAPSDIAYEYEGIFGGRNAVRGEGRTLSMQTKDVVRNIYVIDKTGTHLISLNGKYKSVKTFTNNQVLSINQNLPINTIIGNVLQYTAYDIMNNTGGKYYIDKTIERRENMKAITEKGYTKVKSTYNVLISITIASIVVLIGLLYLNLRIFPREAAVTGLLVLAFGATGLYIDKEGWRKKHKCSHC